MIQPGRDVRRVLDWYFERAYGKLEGPGVLPFYCDPSRVGHFAVARDELAAGNATALFRLLIGQAMFQARRDVLIMRHQRAMTRTEVDSLVLPANLARKVSRSPCTTLESANRFESECSVSKAGKMVDCAHHPGGPCHVKRATTLFNRVGDMGKLPTSAWLHLAKDGDLNDLLADVVAQSDEPRERARLLVARFSRVHRIGRKLATMFVSALSTPPLAPDLTPWFPTIDGSDLVVVDTNVARAAVALGAASVAYDAVTLWVQKQARRVDLRIYGRALTQYSPRVVQQALYVFCSKSNRVAHQDPCVAATAPCRECVVRLCPFAMSPKAARPSSPPVGRRPCQSQRSPMMTSKSLVQSTSKG